MYSKYYAENGLFIDIYVCDSGHVLKIYNKQEKLYFLFFHARGKMVFSQPH